MRSSSVLEPFARRKTALLTTYKRDGAPVATPVTLAVVGDRAYFRTYDKAWKSKRLRRNPDVEVAPSNLRGKLYGEPLQARARLLTGDEERRARRALARRSPFLQGVFVPVTHKLARYKTLHYELTPRQ